MEQRNQPKKPTPWRVTFPADCSTHEAFTRACAGNHHMAYVLDYFLYTASWTAHNKHMPADCTEVELKRTHEDILNDLPVPISLRTLNSFLKQLHEQGVVIREPYQKTYRVCFQPCQYLINNPPPRATRHNWLHEKGGKCANLPTLESVQGLEEKCASMQNQIAYLEEKCASMQNDFAQKYAEVAEKCAMIAQKYAVIAHLHTTVPPDGGRDESHFSDATIITIPLLSLTEEKNESVSVDAENTPSLFPPSENGDHPIAKEKPPTTKKTKQTEKKIPAPKVPAVPKQVAVSDVTPEDGAVIDAWCSIFKHPIPRTPGLIKAAKMLAPCHPTKDQLVQVRAFCYSSNPAWFGRTGKKKGNVTLLDVAEYWSGWFASQDVESDVKEESPAPNTKGRSSFRVISSFDDPDYDMTGEFYKTAAAAAF